MLRFQQCRLQMAGIFEVLYERCFDASDSQKAIKRPLCYVTDTEYHILYQI